MKLIKYIFFIIILVGSIFFLQTFIELNTDFEGASTMIRIPYMEVDHPGFKAWIIFLVVLTAGVIIGFFLALFQIITYKTESISLRSKLKRVQHELDDMRNQNIDDDIIFDGYDRQDSDL